MPGILYVVATPIGNLEDVTLRALRVLREVSVIAAEDTRRTARLLQHYSISTPTTSLHEHNEHARVAGLVDRLRAGDSIALVSDAGTPLISDPGAQLVAAAHAAGLRVEPVPGPSALTAVLSASGIGGDGFVFAGFPPSRSSARRKWLQGLALEQRPVVLYEAPHRIHGTLADIQTELGERQIIIGRELTKSHEQLAIRPTSGWISDPPPERGEFVLVIAPAQAESGQTEKAVSDIDVADLFGRLTENDGFDRRGAIREIARRHGLRTRDVFAALDRRKDLGE